MFIFITNDTFGIMKVRVRVEWFQVEKLCAFLCNGRERIPEYYMERTFATFILSHTIIFIFKYNCVQKSH